MTSYSAFSRRLFSFIEQLLIFNNLKKYFKKTYEFFLDTTSILQQPILKCGQILLITVVSYLSDALVWYFAFQALNQPVAIISMYLGQTLSALTYLIPAAPGYVGSAEASGLLILSGVLGFDSNLSSAMIVLFHVSVLIAILIYGVISIYGLKIDLSVLLKKALKKE